MLIGRLRRDAGEVETRFGRAERAAERERERLQVGTMPHIEFLENKK